MKEADENRKRRLPAAERRKVILDAALSAFVEFGYHGALMDTIAERAEVTKPILYRHFSSKLDLLLAIIDNAGDELRSSLLLPNPSEMDWRTSIRHSVHAYFEFVTRSEAAFRLIYDTDLNVDAKARERVIQIRKSIIEVVSGVVASYTDTARVSREDIDVLAVILIGMVESTVTYWMNNKDRPPEKYEQSLVDAISAILSRLPARTAS
ncbi:MAG: TetR/AcrR family transcriptional regulator [Actinobacteria bacterium]|nr:TetR/AcrR family transcriptional regulator [Actinomycetota bacterium]MDI6831216.1 TetR/AcrR family transcriptional regulator [Actinomycetota bacterium]